jgi:LysM repeat protein
MTLALNHQLQLNGSNLKVLLRIIFVFTCFYTAESAIAQQFNQKQVQLIDGKTYYLHKIEKGNTLYSLSKMYSVKIKDLIGENPQLEKGLKIGQVIRIPVKKVDTKAAANNPPKAEGKYLIHSVIAKETMYSLSRKYEISTDNLTKSNPQTKEGLKEGMELRIPIERNVVINATQKVIAPAVEDSFELHFVEPKETLYSLAKEYDVNMDSIRIVNNGLADGLKVGTTIRLPIAKAKSISVSDALADIIPLKEDSSVFKEDYQIVIMLPFYFDLNDTLEQKRRSFEPEKILPASEVAMGIYTGFKLALDSLRTKGYKFKVLVYDTKYDRKSRSNQVVKDILLDMELVNTDLFIGPLYRPNFEVVQKYADAIGSANISPVPQSNSILDTNLRTIKVNSGSKAQVDFIRNMVLTNFKDKNLVLIENNELKDVLLAEHFKGIYNGDTNKVIFNAVNTNFQSLKIWDFDTAKIKYLLDDSIPNVLVMPLNSKTFVTRMLNALNRYSKDYDITVVGMDAWGTFGYLDIKYLNNLNVHIPYNQFVDYNYSATDKIIEKYRVTYKSDPNDWTFLGYDIGLYFLESLQKYGIGFYKNYPTDTYRGVSKNFRFSRLNPNGGFENTALKMVKIENYFHIEVE